MSRQKRAPPRAARVRATGETFFNPLFFQVFGGRFVRPGLVGSWISSFSPSAGAGYALWRLRQGGSSESSSPPQDVGLPPDPLGFHKVVCSWFAAVRRLREL